MIDRLLFWKFDNVESTNLRYGKFAQFLAPGPGLLSTSGSSTTVTADTTGAYADVKVGDLLRITTDPYGASGPTVSTVKITAKASDSSITVSSAINIVSKGPWSYLVSEVPASGTAAGWFYVGDCASKSVFPVVTTVAAAGGIDYSLEAKSVNGDISVLAAGNYAAAGDGIPIAVAEDVLYLRFGVKGGSGFAGTDDITVNFTGTERS